MGFKSDMTGFIGYWKMAKGKKTEAEKYLSKAYSEGITKPAYLTAYGALLMQNQNYEKCLEVYNRALENSPEGSAYMSAIKCSIITCRYKLGQEAEALEEAEKLYEKQKNSTIYTLYGYLLMKAGRFEEALKVNLEGYEYDEKDVAVCDNLGQTYYLMGDTANAKIYFEKAIDIKYNMVDSCYFLAEIYLEEDNLKKAYDLLDDAKDAPFSALTTVTREQIEQKLNEVESLMNQHDI